jgi:hypothetical protein
MSCRDCCKWTAEAVVYIIIRPECFLLASNHLGCCMYYINVIYPYCVGFREYDLEFSDTLSTKDVDSWQTGCYDYINQVHLNVLCVYWW